MPAYFHSSIADFILEDSTKIVGQLTIGNKNEGFLDQKHKQVKAWEKEISILKQTFSEMRTKWPGSEKWSVLLEYPIPRRQKRIDLVILADDVIFCIEFKTEDKTYPLYARRQVEDYALDLRDFHEGSLGRAIIPILVAVNAQNPFESQEDNNKDVVRPVQGINAVGLANCLHESYRKAHDPAAAHISSSAWQSSAYRPVPTIIEAAEALYAGHNVREIVHSHAGDENLTTTSDKLVEIIQRAQKKKQNVICFVTGVPGAGKTLVGLNVVHNPALRLDGRPPGVFLSGNGPLVKIISAAIAKDAKRRKRETGAERKTGTFIQNVHGFVREALDKPDQLPPEHVIIFDEAQRAWDSTHNAKKTGEERSEPEVMLSIMSRHTDWSVIIALVGGGQEIHDGEAGLAEWGRSLRKKYRKWHIAVSPQASHGSADMAGHKLFSENDDQLLVQKEPSLHLEVNRRSFRAQRITEWVEAVLRGESEAASSIMTALRDFPIALTRSLSTAKAWLHGGARGFRRSGLVASSGAIRLRADGLELSSGFRQGNRDLYVNWFLAEPPDVRSSNQLEVAASEFECQGLELDWVGVCWGGDFIRDNNSKSWIFQNFSGSKWGIVRREMDREYILNTYRVLLTRAREGFVIWIPPGDQEDITRRPQDLHDTYTFFKACGVPTV